MLTIVCLLATLTIINAIPASAGTLIITPTLGGPEEPPPGQVEPPDRVIVVEVEIPEVAGEDLSGVAELNPILEYVIDPMPPPGPQL